MGCAGILIVGCFLAVAQPSKTQFEAEKSMLLQRIQDIQQILQQTSSQKKISLSHLKALNEQLESNAQLIQTLTQEIQAINQEIQQKQQSIAALGQDMAQLKREYAAMVYVGAKSLHDIHLLMFIFSASSFHKLVQKLRYTKQYAHIRHRHFLEIEKNKALLQSQRAAATRRKQEKTDLLQARQIEKAKLNNLQSQQRLLIGKLEQQHLKLTEELRLHNQAVQRLDKLITDIIQQDLKAQQEKQDLDQAISSPSTNHRPVSTKKLTSLFRKSRGKLPWPVKTGFISGKFGIRPHPVLHNVLIENLGIEIQTQAGAQVYAVFDGLVKTVASVPEMNQVVIVQHGAYYSVYAKLEQTIVKVGQQVRAQEPIGRVYTDTQGNTELQLQLWENTQKLNPTQWLCKK